MLSVDRAPDGDYTILVLFPHASLLSELPKRLRELLTDPARNRDVIGRLFPAAYADPRQEAEYRRLLGDDLLRQKQQGVETFERSLRSAKLAQVPCDTGGGRSELVPALCLSLAKEDFDLWLGFVNDMRLTLGTELDIQDEGWEANFDPDDPHADDWTLLHLLSWLEEELLGAAG